MTGAEFHETYERHKDVLYRFARRMTGSNEAAEDLVDGCFLMLWRNTVAYRPERGTMRSFLLGITRNLALKRLQRERPFDRETLAFAACHQPAEQFRDRLLRRHAHSAVHRRYLNHRAPRRHQPVKSLAPR